LKGPSAWHSVTGCALYARPWLIGLRVEQGKRQGGETLQGLDRDHEEAQRDVRLRLGTNYAALPGMPYCNVMTSKR
jgi:hypothetical protein